ncbi:unnamed protein product [Prunus armeniaca]
MLPIFDNYGENEEEEITWSDHGESLVIRRIINAAKVEENSNWLRNNIFHTKCTSHGKEMVDKLNLKTEKKPVSYKLSWVKKGNEVVVNQRCLVTFSIGQKYQDSQWCDVILMDACHILLGRPWQFDRKATHDGYKNTYTFIKDGTKVILGPSQSEFNVKSTKIGAGSFLTKGEFLKEAEESGDMYMLMVKESNPDVLNFPKELTPLLQEFNDVIPEELPAGLPPMRDIQHRIDLIPGSTLPNKSHYRMSPLEYEELNRQVTELLKKGVI